MSPLRILAYLWASPSTAIGLLLAGAGLATGGRARAVGGVLEVHGGVVRFVLRRCTLLRGGAAALTLGHVVLGADAGSLERTRRHERVHVRQCERFGPLFVPLYLLASAWQLARGGHPYLDNPFEREARRRAGN